MKEQRMVGDDYGGFEPHSFINDGRGKVQRDQPALYGSTGIADVQADVVVRLRKSGVGPCFQRGGDIAYIRLRITNFHSHKECSPKYAWPVARIAVSSDEYGHLVEVVLRELKARKHEAFYFGPSAGEEAQDWPLVTSEAVRMVADGEADEAIVMCWTGTGCAIAANKVPGIRAALCHDAATAKGARVWNHANVLALSMRATPEAIAKEILELWFATPYSEDEWNLLQMKRLRTLETGTPDKEA